MFKTSRFIVFLCLLGLLQPALAAKSGKSAKPSQSSKEKLVLMPLRLEEEQKLQGTMESALVEGLQNKYTVMWGEEVERKAKEIFRKENLKHECNEERCMQGIAESFQSELLATANVTKQDGGYFLTFTIQNLFDHVVVFTKSATCEGCTAFKVVDKLRELGIAAAPVAAAPAGAIEPEAPKVTATDPESALWNEVKSTNLLDDYQTYLAQYPKGKYVALANSRIGKIKEAAASEAARKEQQVWASIEQSGKEADYQRYLNDYPQGSFTGVAQIKIRKLQAERAEREQQAQQAANARRQQQAAQANSNNVADCVFPGSNEAAPDWICDAPVEGVEVSAVGMAEKSAAGEAFMKQMAAVSARVQLAQRMKVQIANMLKQYLESRGTASAEIIDRLNTSVTKQITNETLVGTRIYKSRTGPEGEIYVLVGMDEAAVQQLSETAIKASMNNDAGLWQQLRAGGAQDELATEIARQKVQ
jgi:hypothetical protein